MLTHIRSVAVKGTHKEVHRMNFSKLNQMEGETISQFVARLKSQASLCQFNITCNAHDPPKKLSYADDMVTQQLIAGLGNQQHQSRVLAEATTLITLAAEIARLQCLESTEESTTQMRNQPTGQPNNISRAEIARQSNYRRFNKLPPANKSMRSTITNCTATVNRWQEKTASRSVRNATTAESQDTSDQFVKRSKPKRNHEPTPPL